MQAELTLRVTASEKKITSESAGRNGAWERQSKAGVEGKQKVLPLGWESGSTTVGEQNMQVICVFLAVESCYLGQP